MNSATVLSLKCLFEGRSLHYQMVLPTTTRNIKILVWNEYMDITGYFDTQYDGINK